MAATRPHLFFLGYSTEKTRVLLLLASQAYLTTQWIGCNHSLISCSGLIRQHRDNQLLNAPAHFSKHTLHICQKMLEFSVSFIQIAFKLGSRVSPGAVRAIALLRCATPTSHEPWALPRDVQTPSWRNMSTGVWRTQYMIWQSRFPSKRNLHVERLTPNERACVFLKTVKN